MTDPIDNESLAVLRDGIGNVPIVMELAPRLLATYDSLCGDLDHSHDVETMDDDQVNAVLDQIGRLIDDEPEAWARVAMGCIDQAMVRSGAQDEITRILRREGIDVETVES